MRNVPAATEQARELERLARREREEAGFAPPPPPYVHLSRLEHPPVPTARATVVTSDGLVAIDGALTDKQRALLDAVLAAPSVSAAAADLGVSRSNVYASLRRVGRKVGVTDVSEVLRLLRAGALASAMEG
jgi:DNA-binding NarL/FixJ family response regulator